MTDVVSMSPGWIPIALALFGIGMTAGNLLGGRIADLHPARGIVVGFGSAVIVLAIVASFGSSAPTLFVGLFCVGATMMTAIPTIQVRLTRLAPEAPTLMGAMNLAALNVANAIGAFAGGLAIGSGLGLLSAVWAGFCLTLMGLGAFALVLRGSPRMAPAQ